ncbi:APC family permease [Candidatus Dependentiae bacterium]|nr:APC family permease [Candidatus Dependentiae bacterium]
MSKHKLSLASAIAININIMLGAGIFINTVLLAKNAGFLGGLVYPLVGLLILPLIVALTFLTKQQIGGTFYHFGKVFNPFIGFLSSWIYFTAKLASCALGIHVFVSLMQQIFLTLKMYNTLFLDLTILTLFVMLNLLNLRIGRSIQFSFIALKLIPIIFAITTGAILFSGANIDISSLNLLGIPASIPFVLFAFSGFEASCSLSDSIEDSEKNAGKAMLISYLLVISIVTLYQILFYGALGSQLTQLNSYLNAFPALIEKLGLTNFKMLFIAILNSAIASSALGASYGIMYSNSWNLYTLAQNKHLFFSEKISQLNKHFMPFVCIIVEGLIAATYLILTRGNQVPLQQTSAFGGAIAYTISCAAFLYLSYKNNQSKIWPILSILSCTLLLAAAMRSFIVYGLMPLFLFFIIVLFGIMMFHGSKNNYDAKI